MPRAAGFPERWQPMAMFDETLLDSSTKRASVLKPVHWYIAIGVGVLGYIVGYFSLGLIFAGTEGGALATQSLTMAVLLGFYALILCYVRSDTGHLGFSRPLWVAIVAIFNLVGF